MTNREILYIGWYTYLPKYVCLNIIFIEILILDTKTVRERSGNITYTIGGMVNLI